MIDCVNEEREPEDIGKENKFLATLLAESRLLGQRNIHVAHHY